MALVDLDSVSLIVISAPEGSDSMLENETLIDLDDLSSFDKQVSSLHSLYGQLYDPQYSSVSSFL